MKKIIYAFILSILFAFLIPVKAQAEEPYRYIIDESESDYLTSEELSIIDEYLIQANSKESYDLYFYFVKDINKRDVLLDEYSYLENNKVVFIDFNNRQMAYCSYGYSSDIPNLENVKSFLARNDFYNGIKEIIFEITNHLYQEDTLKLNYIINYTDIEIENLDSVTQKATDVYKRTNKPYYFLFINNNYNYLEDYNEYRTNLDSSNIFVINLDTRHIEMSSSNDNNILNEVAIEYFKDDKYVDGINAILDFVISGQSVSVQEEQIASEITEQTILTTNELLSSMFPLLLMLGGLILVLIVGKVISFLLTSGYSYSYSGSSSNSDDKVSEEDEDVNEDEEYDLDESELYDILREYAKEDYKTIGNGKDDIINSLVDDLEFEDEEDLFDALENVIDIDNENISDYIFEKYNEYINEFKKEDKNIVKENSINNVGQISNSPENVSKTNNVIVSDTENINNIKIDSINKTSISEFNIKKFNKEIAEACELSCTKENYNKVNKLIKQFNNLKFSEKMQVDYSTISRLQTLNNKIEHLK